MTTDPGIPAPRRPLVLTVTPNPSLDLLFHTDRLVWDDANRMNDPRRRPGGQGINVTRAVRTLGGGSAAVTLLGGSTGRQLAAALAAEATPLRIVEAIDETRTFVAVTEQASGRSMLLNARGPAREPADAARLADAVTAAIDELRPRWLACCGSLPGGFPPAFYADLVGVARARGVRVVVDCDGEPLRLAADAGCDLLVPNQHEAARLCRQRLQDLDDAVQVARTLQRAGTPVVCITLAARGAVLAADGGCWTARPPTLTGGSAVGAGDAFLAGVLVALDAGKPPDHALRYAVAAAAATLRSADAELLNAADAAALLPLIT